MLIEIFFFTYLLLISFVKRLLRHKDGQRLFINPMGAMPQGLVFVKGGRKRVGDVTPVPLGSKESHDPPTAQMP
jgi:hypothetical protein